MKKVTKRKRAASKAKRSNHLGRGNAIKALYPILLANPTASTKQLMDKAAEAGLAVRANTVQNARLGFLGVVQFLQDASLLSANVL